MANFVASEKFAMRVTTPPGLVGNSSHMRNSKIRPRWYVKEWLVHKSMKQADLVDRTGHTKSEVSEWVNEGRRYNADVLAEFARAIGVDPAELLQPPGESKPEGTLVGKIGAGAEITRMEEGTHLGGVPIDFLKDFPNVAEIEGDSQYPLQDRWRVFYGPENQGVPERCVGHLCAVQELNGPCLLKTLKRGSRKGLWRLESWNAPPREDVKLVWAALVGGIQPR